MKNLCRLLIIVIIIAGCSSEKKYFLEGKVELVNSEIVKDIEIRLYNYVSGKKEKEIDLIDFVKTNAKGNYIIEIPSSNTWYKIHISYPNYESFRTELIMIDENPKLNANLVPAAISEKVKEVSLIGDFNDFNWDKAIAMSEIDNDLYESEIKHDQPEMRYQFLFDTEHHSFSDISGDLDYEYDHGGDYYSIIYSDSALYKIIVNLNKYPKYNDINKKEISFGNFNDAPMLNEYEEIEKEIEQMNLVSYFSTLIYEHYDEKERKMRFGNVSSEKIEELISEAKIQISRANTYIDSMLIMAQYSPSVDFLLDQKIYLKCVNMESFMFTDFLKLFKQIGNLNFTKRNGNYKTLMWYPEFKENEVKYLKMIKEKIIDSYVENKRDRQLFYYYYALSQFDQNIYNGKEYSHEILRVLTEIEPNLPDLKDRIEKLKNKINLYTLDYAPDFNFTDLHGNYYKLSDFRGKWIFLDFWATWCTPCKVETDNLKSVREAVSVDTLIIIGIAKEDDKEVLSQYVKANNMNWMQTLDPEDNIFMKFGVSGIPQFFLINPDGLIVKDESQFRGSLMKERILKAINSYD